MWTHLLVQTHYREEHQPNKLNMPIHLWKNNSAFLREFMKLHIFPTTCVYISSYVYIQCVYVSHPCFLVHWYTQLAGRPNIEKLVGILSCEFQRLWLLYPWPLYSNISLSSLIMICHHSNIISILCSIWLSLLSWIRTFVILQLSHGGDKVLWTKSNLMIIRY